jgi:predicted Fe-Mo cluster-binding NifX family protein
VSMRIAIPQWQGRVSPVFDVAGSLLLVDFEGGGEVRRKEVRLAQTDALGRAADLARLGADVLVCGAISAPLEARLAAAGVRVIGFVCGPVEDILAGFVKGELAKSAFRMPGCWGQHRRLREGRNFMASGFGPGSGRGRGRRAGGGRGRMGGPLAGGPGGECVCPKCGEKAPHAAGRPCVQVTCPKCGTPMIRA